MSGVQPFTLHILMFQVCIDVIVQRLGDASAAGMYKLLFVTLSGRRLLPLFVPFLYVVCLIHAK